MDGAQLQQERRLAHLCLGAQSSGEGPREPPLAIAIGVGTPNPCQEVQQQQPEVAAQQPRQEGQRGRTDGEEGPGRRWPLL